MSNFNTLLEPLEGPIIWTHSQDLANLVPQRPPFAPVKPPSRNLKQLRQGMATTGIAVLPSLFTAAQCELLAEHFYANKDKHVRTDYQDNVMRSSIHNSGLTRHLHEMLVPLVNQLVPSPVKASYTFSSVYDAESRLPAHYDSRPACTWNISLVVDASTKALACGWPLFIETHNQRHQVRLHIGDAVLYSGTEALHWRDTMPSMLTSMFGVFFHFAPYDYTGSLN